MLVNLNPEILEGDLFLFKETSSESYMVYYDGDIQAKYDKDDLDFGNDKGTFYKDIYLNENVRKVFEHFPLCRLHGCYENKDFVVTDVTYPADDEDIEKGYMLEHFEGYHHYLAHIGIKYRAPIVKIMNHKDSKYIHRLVDAGVWHFKNYGKQLFESWEISKSEE